MKRSDVIKIMEEFAPPELAEPWDNCGMLIEGNEMVEKISVILDPTLNTLKSTTGEFIISHHPLIFSPLKSLDHDIKYKVKVLLSKEQTFYAAHTNLDFAEKGISWALAQRIGLQEDEGSTPRSGLGIFHMVLCMSSSTALWPCLKRKSSRWWAIRRK